VLGTRSSARAVTARTAASPGTGLRLCGIASRPQNGVKARHGVRRWLPRVSREYQGPETGPIRRAMIVTIALLFAGVVAAGLAFAMFRRRSTPAELRGDWWPAFEAKLQEYVARSSPSPRSMRRTSASVGCHRARRNRRALSGPHSRGGSLGITGFADRSVTSCLMPALCSASAGNGGWSQGRPQSMPGPGVAGQPTESDRAAGLNRPPPTDELREPRAAADPGDAERREHPAHHGAGSPQAARSWRESRRT
jgi:hypothetical protein